MGFIWLVIHALDFQFGGLLFLNWVEGGAICLDSQLRLSWGYITAQIPDKRRSGDPRRFYLQAQLIGRPIESDAALWLLLQLRLHSAASLPIGH